MKKLTPEGRLAVLLAAKVNGNVRATCEEHGMDHSTFYKLRRRVENKPQNQWLAELEDQSRCWKSHGQQTTDAQRRAIVELALQLPSWGCRRIHEELKKSRIRRSANTVQQILISEGLGKRADRARRLDVFDADLKRVQKEIVERFNPAYRERGRRGKRPGARVHVGTVSLGKLPNLGELVLFVGIDTFSSYAFGAIRRKPTSAIAESVLGEWLLPEMQKKVSDRIDVIVSPRSPEYKSKYGSVLKKAGIKHQWRASENGTSGFVARFADAVERDFMMNVARKDVYDRIGQLQRAFKNWRADYNKRSLDGFPNYGESPVNMLSQTKEWISFPKCKWPGVNFFLLRSFNLSMDRSDVLVNHFNSEELIKQFGLAKSPRCYGRK